MRFIVHSNVLLTDELGRILFVKEKKGLSKGRLNLPGGHLELGESLVECAKREAREEVGVRVEITHLIGVYAKVDADHKIGFVFAGKIICGEPKANKADVESCGWYAAKELDKMPDGSIVNPRKNRDAIAKFQRGEICSLGTLEEWVFQNPI